MKEATSVFVVALGWLGTVGAAHAQQKHGLDLGLAVQGGYLQKKLEEVENSEGGKKGGVVGVTGDVGYWHNRLSVGIFGSLLKPIGTPDISTGREIGAQFRLLCPSHPWGAQVRVGLGDWAWRTDGERIGGPLGSLDVFYRWLSDNSPAVVDVFATFKLQSLSTRTFGYDGAPENGKLIWIGGGIRLGAQPSIELR